MADERFGANLELENSAFLAALKEADTETSEFLDAHKLFEAGETKGTESTTALADALANLKEEEFELVAEEQKLADETDAVTHAMRDMEKEAGQASTADRELSTATKEVVKDHEAHEMSAHHAHRGLHQLTLGISELTHGTKDMAEMLEKAANHLEMSAIVFGAEGPMFLALMALSTIIGLVATNWETISKLWEGTDTSEPVEAIDKITAAIDKQNTARQKSENMRKASEAQKQAGHDFARSLGKVGGMERALKAGQDLGWDVDQLSDHLTRGMNGDEDAIDQLHEWLQTSGRGANGQMPINSPLGDVYREALGHRATRCNNAVVGELNKQGKENEERFKEGVGRDSYADQAEATKDQQRTAGDIMKGADDLIKDIKKNGEHANEAMDKSESKRPQMLAERAARRQVQEEFASMGEGININDAIQLAKRRQAEQQRLYMDTLGTLLNFSEDINGEMNQLRQFNGQARKLHDNNRTNQNVAPWP